MLFVNMLDREQRRLLRTLINSASFGPAVVATEIRSLEHESRE